MRRSLQSLLQEKPWAVSIALVAAFLPLKLWGSDLGYLNIHAARDWERGWQLLHGVRFWHHGAEMQYGGSTPGFFFYILTGLFQIPHRNPILAAYAPSLFFALSIGFFHDLVRRFVRPGPALLAGLAYGAFPLGTIAIRYLWNPSYLFLFTTLSLWFVARAVTEKRKNLMAWGLLVSLLAAQIHISAYNLSLAIILAMAIWKLRPEWKWLAVVAGIHLAFILPYYVVEYQRGWPDANRAIFNEKRADVELVRVKPVGNFLSALSRQFIVQPPGMKQDIPFSYYERFYRHSGQKTRVLANFAFVLSLAIPAVFVAGFVSVVKPRREVRQEERNDEETDRRTFARFCLLLMAIVFLPVLLWNPALGVEAKTDHPLRYYYVFWPSQFILFAFGLEAASRWMSPDWRPAGRLVNAVVAAMIVTHALLTVQFTRYTIRTGQPFQYLTFEDWSVHALRDKVWIARQLVNRFGLTEDLFLTRVHSGGLLFQGEESLDYEIRAAIESADNPPPPDPSLYYFLFEPRDRKYITGDIQPVEALMHRSIGVLVYRSNESLEGWQPDPPISWWTY